MKPNTGKKVQLMRVYQHQNKRSWSCHKPKKEDLVYQRSLHYALGFLFYKVELIKRTTGDS